MAAWSAGKRLVGALRPPLRAPAPAVGAHTCPRQSARHGRHARANAQPHDACGAARRMRRDFASRSLFPAPRPARVPPPSRCAGCHGDGMRVHRVHLLATKAAEEATVEGPPSSAMSVTVTLSAPSARPIARSDHSDRCQRSGHRCQRSAERSERSGEALRALGRALFFFGRALFFFGRALTATARSDGAAAAQRWRIATCGSP